MIKSLSAIAVAALLLLGVGLYESFFVGKEFSGFREELLTLSEKAENETANGEDAKAVLSSWEARKARLYVWIPHNDIARVDDYMAETVRLVTDGEYGLALAKLGVLVHMSECLPGTYAPALENVF